MLEPFEARGLSYLAIGDYKAALEDFNEVVKRDRNSYAGWTNQGLALEKLGERDKAFAAFAKAAASTRATARRPTACAERAVRCSARPEPFRKRGKARDARSDARLPPLATIKLHSHGIHRICLGL